MVSLQSNRPVTMTLAIAETILPRHAQTDLASSSLRFSSQMIKDSVKLTTLGIMVGFIFRTF